jgi:phosphinothricin acetyltransferase
VSDTPALRLAEARDASACLAIYAPAILERSTSFEYNVPTVDEMARRIAAALPAFPWLVAVRKGEVIGYAYASRHKERDAYGWSVDVSAYIRGDCHRQGIGRGLYTSLFKLLALQGYRRAWAGVTLPNPGSVGLHEAMGFRKVGVYEKVGWKFGRWHDVAWFGRSLGLEDGEPSQPLSVEEARALPGWNEALVWSSS